MNNKMEAKAKTERYRQGLTGKFERQNGTAWEEIEMPEDWTIGAGFLYTTQGRERGIFYNDDRVWEVEPKSADVVVKHTFDAEGRETYYEDETGFWRERRYDRWGHETWFANSLGYFRRAKYRANGNIISTEDATGY